MPTRVAGLDPALRATIVSRVALTFRAGPDRALDRPAHVRAGSSLTWIGDRLAVIQDDANFVALVDPSTGLADAITLPAGEAGLRLFDDARGNKKFKLYLEACCVVPGIAGPTLVAFGSGSKKRRRRVVTVDRWDASEPRVSLVDAEALYLALDAAADFAGSDMNIEGALALTGTLRLFGRGNGKKRGARIPLNATCELPIGELLDYLAAPAAGPVPTPRSIVQYELGDIGGVSLGFTDAAASDGAILYSAAAEASSDAVDDGEVHGSVLGVIPAAGELRFAHLVDDSGRRVAEKVEGLVCHRDVSNTAYIVIDSDDAGRPSELCTVRLDGHWR